MADNMKRPHAGMRMGGGPPEGAQAEYTPPVERGPELHLEEAIGGGTRFRSMRGERLKAIIRSIEEDIRYINALIIFSGCLFLLLLFKFYPIYIIPIIAFIAGVIGFRSAPFGIVFAEVLAFPAIAYQSPLFAWLFLLVMAGTMFRAFTDWKLISLLFILIASPFTIFGFLIIPFHVLAGLLVGSKKGALVTAITVTTVLVLSAIWQTQNEGFMVYNPKAFERMYQGSSQVFLALKLAKPEPFPTELGNEFKNGLAGMFNWGDVTRYLNDAIIAVTNSFFILFVNDSAALQVVLWTVAVFIIGYVPGRVKWKNKNTIASLASILILIAIAISTFLSQVSFNLLAIPSTIIAIGIVYLLEKRGIDLSREIMVIKEEKMAKFAKFGLQDLSLARGVERLADVGNYEQTKKELIETIVVPMQKKELQVAYGLKPPKGVLLFGPPGTGKTMLMRALSRELDIGFYYVKVSEILSQWYGESLPYDEQLLVMEEGMVRREAIGRIVEERRPVRVAAFDEKGRVVFADVKAHIKHRSTSPIYEVRTKTGRRIKVTGYHSLFTLRGGSVVSVPTSELVPGKSFIAVPRSIPAPEHGIEQIDFLSALSAEDHGLSVRGGDKHVKDAVARIGPGRACELLGLKRVYDLNRRLRTGMGFPVAGFVRLIKAAGLKYDAEELRICVRTASLPARIEIDDEFATFLGLWVARGSYKGQHVVRISTSVEGLDRIIAICKRFGNTTVYRKGSEADIYISSRPLFVLLRYVLGLEHEEERKRLPDFALSMDNARLASLLRGYFSGAGTVYHNQHGVGTIECGTVSPRLADDLQYALLRFGIVARVLRIPAQERSAEFYRVLFEGMDDLRRFGTIGFIDRGRQTRLGELAGTGWTRSAQIPIDTRLPGLLADKLPSRIASGSAGVGIPRTVDWSEEEMFPAALYEESGIYFDEVVAITRVEDAEYVYDVSVEPCQNFIGGSGGIFAHNSERNITEIFNIARQNAPCILFFDEVDSIGKKREYYSADDVAPRLLSVMLTEMDGFKSEKPVIIVGATNVPHMLDAALLRPGRFDKIIYMPLPDKKGRKKIFQVHTKNLPLAPDIDFDKLAEKSDRYSGADIKNLVTEAARRAAMLAQQADRVIPITMNDFIEVMETIKPSVGISLLEDYERFRLEFERRAMPEERKKAEKPVTWKDVVGLDDVREALLEAIELPLLHEDLLKEYKVTPIKGILLFGPPGCGKTMIVKAAANELNATFLFLSGADLLKMGYEGALRSIRETFNRAKERAPALIFIDEIETIAPARDIAASSPLGKEIVGQFLNELDGVKELKNVLFIGATNRPDIIDTALLRPGRFDKIMFIHPPLYEGRQEIFRKNLEGIPLSHDVNFEELSKKTDGFTGADLVSICQEAKMRLVRGRLAGKRQKLSQRDLLDIIRDRRPSITPQMLRSYMAFLEEYGERR